MKRRLIATLALVALAVQPVVPRAQTASDDAARAAYEQGEAAFGAGDYSGAIDAWERAWDLSGRPALLYNLALAAEAAGEFAQAIEYLDRYIDIGENVDLPALTEWIATLRSQIPAVLAEGSGGADGGQTVAEAAAPPLAEGSGAVEGSGDAVAEPEDPGPDEPGEPRSRMFGAVEGSLTGLSASSLFAAVVLGASTRKLGARLEGRCAEDGGDWICSEDDRRDVDRERRLGIATDAAIGVGALSALGLVVALLVDRDEDDVEVAVTPFGDGVRVNISGRF
jgi:hypothetical protein